MYIGISKGREKIQDCVYECHADNTASGQPQDKMDPCTVKKLVIIPPSRITYILMSRSRVQRLSHNQFLRKNRKRMILKSIVVYRIVHKWRL